MRGCVVRVVVVVFLLFPPLLLFYGREKLFQLRTLFLAHYTISAYPIFCRKELSEEEYRYVTVPSEGCGSGVELVVFVISHPEEIARRRAIRETWGTELKKYGNVSLFFVLGVPRRYGTQTQVSMEAAKHNDILQVHICELYSLLTLKVHSFLHWKRRACPRVRFTLKQDSDTFIMVDHLRQFIRFVRKREVTPAIWCLLSPHTATPTDTVPPSSYTGSHLPPYCSGHAYLLGTGIDSRLLYGTVKQAFVGVEDILFTGIIPNKLGIDRKHASGFLGEFARKINCKSPNYVTIHRVSSPESVHKVWNLYRQMRQCPRNATQ